MADCLARTGAVMEGKAIGLEVSSGGEASWPIAWPVQCLGWAGCLLENRARQAGWKFRGLRGRSADCLAPTGCLLDGGVAFVFGG